ncbi:MAG TPA: PIN domain-containing protein [Candidatus Nanoarchaeia archaeon]|nr:PIN domain-containing protein [Candidatus Nanoarchaeia archaeon]
MDLIIDANILFSALISSEGRTFDFIFNDRFRLYAPEFLLEEIKNHREEIITKSGLSYENFNLLFDILLGRIAFIPRTEFNSFRKLAKEISPDINDTEYFALALKLNCAIWTNDKILKNQERIKVYSTQELLSSLHKEI